MVQIKIIYRKLVINMKYSEQNLVKIAKRENNKKRSYLLVNPLQGKHIPVSPMKAMQLFDSLADKIKDRYKDEKILFVGFAETATAIGARVAVNLGANYIQTTREIIPDVNYMFFSEEHSHATEQKLVKNDIDGIIKEVDRIIFIEDEITTGKTILNIIDILEKQYPNKLKYGVASLLNGMTDEHLSRYKKRKIEIQYLVKTDHSDYKKYADKYINDGDYICNLSDEKIEVPILNIEGKMDARRLVNGKKYEEACQRLWNKVNEKIGNIKKEKILVVGTEEFMYPSLYIGSMLENLENEVKCHSTTRSPIMVSRDKEYPLHTRYELRSLYDSERKTFIYDIDKYDRVLVITDSSLLEKKGIISLVNALNEKNENIVVIRWC
jgi:hypoxanthine-guanine phosphoribosyltransferase